MSTLIIVIALIKMFEQILWPVNIQAKIGQYDLQTEMSARFASHAITALPSYIDFDAKGILVNKGERIPFVIVGTTRLAPPRMDAHVTFQETEADVACVATIYPDERLHVLCASPQFPEISFDTSVNVGPFKALFSKK
jgi:hypothetical protein